MMIVLVTLGAFCVSAANVNLKLCQKALSWNQVFYELDGAGERFKAEIDYILAAAERAALDYMLSGGYAKPNYTGISHEVQSKIYEMSRTSHTPTDDFLNIAAGMAYFSLAGEMLQDKIDIDRLKSTAEESGLFLDKSEGLAAGIRLEYSAVSALNPDCRITIGLSVNEPCYKDGAIAFDSGSRGKRYAVSGWKQWQTQTDNSEIPYWDGIIR